MTDVKVTSITVIGRRWFREGAGHTYHTVEILVNGQFVHKSERTYGYGNQYEWTARDWLLREGYLEMEGSPTDSLAFCCQKQGIVYATTVIDVGRKADL